MTANCGICDVEDIEDWEEHSKSEQHKNNLKNPILMHEKFMESQGHIIQGALKLDED